MTFIDWIKSISPEWWGVIISTVIGICTGVAFIVKWLIKKYGCPISATINSLNIYAFDKGQKYVFNLVIQNRKDYPITISKIVLKRNESFFINEFNDNPISLTNASSIHVIQEFILPLNFTDCTEHDFIFHIKNKEYKLRLFAQIQNI